MSARTTCRRCCKNVIAVTSDPVSYFFHPARKTKMYMSCSLEACRCTWAQQTRRLSLRWKLVSVPARCSIIEDRDPSAYVIAAEATHLMVIHKDVLWDMVDISHDFSKNLLIVLSERVRSHNHFIAASIGDWKKYEKHAKTDALTSLSNRHAMQNQPEQPARDAGNFSA